MDGRIDGWKDRWMDGWMDACNGMDGSMVVTEWIDG
jgi:hypothetical protein